MAATYLYSQEGPDVGLCSPRRPLVLDGADGGLGEEAHADGGGRGGRPLREPGLLLLLEALLLLLLLLLLDGEVDGLATVVVELVHVEAGGEEVLDLEGVVLVHAGVGADVQERRGRVGHGHLLMIMRFRLGIGFNFTLNMISLTEK